MAAAEYYSNAPLNPSNLTPRVPTPTSLAVPYGADADASYTYDAVHDQPIQFSQPPSASSNLVVPGTIAPMDLNANTSYEKFRPSSAHSTHSTPGNLEQNPIPTVIGPDGEPVEGERGLFGSSSSGGKSKSEKVLKFVIKQVEKQVNKQSGGGGGHGQEQQEQFNQQMPEYSSGQENPYGNYEGSYGDYSHMIGGGSGGHGFSDFLNSGSGGDSGHSWMESLGLSGDSSGDSSGLSALLG